MPTKKINLRSTFAWAVGLVVLDAFLLNQGVIAAVVASWTLVVTVPRAVLAKNSGQKRLRLARAGIMLGAVLLVFAFNAVNNHLARSRAVTLIAALKAFHQQNQRFPTELDELVPDFIDHVPVAKYVLLPPFACFYYMANPGRHSLMYTAMPPFGRPSYRFEEGEWSYMD